MTDDINSVESELRCPYCQERLEHEQSVCMHCGGEMFQCPDCNALIRDEDTTCPNCGASFEEEEVQEETAQVVETTPAAPPVVVASANPPKDHKTTNNTYVSYINTMKEIRGENTEGPMEEIKSKLYLPRTDKIQSFVVLLFLMATIGFVLEFTLLKDFWYTYFNGYNLYLMIVTAAGVGIALYTLIIASPETSVDQEEDRNRKIFGMIGFILVLVGFILLIVFRNNPSSAILLLNIMIFYGTFAAIQMSRTLSMIEVKKLFVVFTGVLMILVVPLHEAFGPFQTEFATLPWNPGNEALLIIGIAIFVFGLTRIKNNSSFLAIWLMGLLILFMIPFHETFGIIASGNYEPWDHTLAIIGIIVGVAGGAGFLARKNRFESIAKYLIYGNKKFAEGNYESALKSYEKARDVADDAKVAFQLSTPWHSMADALANLDREEEALSHYVTALTINPEDEIAWANKGSCLAQMNRRAEGLKCYHRSVELNPNSYSVWIAKGTLETTMGKLEDAVISYETAKNLMPDYKEAWAKQAEVYSLMGKYEKAMGDIDKAIDADPKDHDLLLEKAKIYHKAGYNREAIVFLKKILEHDPHDKWALLETANILFNQQQYENAKSILEILSPEDSTDARIAIMKGKIHLALEDHDAASKLLERAIEVNGERQDLLSIYAEAKDTPYTKKDSVSAHRKIVRKTRGILDFDIINRALECYANAITMSTDVLNAHKGSVEAFLKLQRYHDAMESAESAMAANNRDIEVWSMKSQCLMKLHRYVEAMDCLNEGLKMETESVELWFHKGNTMANMNKFDNAIECYNTALRLNPKHIPSMINRGMCIRSRNFSDLTK